MRKIELWNQLKISEPENWPKRGAVLAAVSGGADSMALLRLLLDWAQKAQRQLYVGHIQHHLRGQASLQDEAFVRRTAKKLGIDFRVRNVSLDPKANREGEARRLRYLALAELARECGATAIATAHHLDDQIETFFLKIARGSGPGNLGMPVLRPLSEITGRSEDQSLFLWRPLLSLRRNELRVVLQQSRQRFREDQSNRDLRLRRNALRHRVLPALAKMLPEFLVQWPKTQELLSLYSAGVEAQLQQLRKKCLITANLGDFSAVSGDFSLLALRSYFRYHESFRLAFLHGEFPTLPFVEIRKLQMHLATLNRRGVAFADLNKWRNLQPPAPAFSALSWTIPGRLDAHPWKMQLEAQWKRSWPRRFSPSQGFGRRQVFLDEAAIKESQLKIRSFIPGDGLQPLGFSGRKKLQDIFVDAKVPQSLRRQIPIIESAGQILWVVGLCQAAQTAITAQTQKALHLKAVFNEK